MTLANCLKTALASGVLAFGLTNAAPLSAQSAEEFYEDLGQLSMIIRSSPGGGYDAYGRLIAKYMGKHLPGQPDVVVENMPGAAGIRAANYLANLAPKDGSEIGMMGRSIPVAPLLEGDDSGAEFDPRDFNWIGSLNREIGVGFVSSDAAVSSIEEARETEIFFGSSGAESTAAMYGRLLNDLVGTKITMLNGYAGQTEYFLAMERGETDGMFITGWSGPNRVQAIQAHEAGDITYIVQLAAKRSEVFGDTPTILELMESEADRQVVNLILSQLELGRPVMAPPGVPEDRMELLQQAFRDAVGDPEFVDEARRLELDVDPIFGDEAEEITAAIYETPEDVIQRTRDIVGAR